MKAAELIKLLEYKAAFKPKPKRRRRRERDFDYDDIDISLLLHKKLDEAATLQKLLDDREKANKKPDKKAEWTIHHVSTALWMTFPIIMYLHFVVGR